MSGDVAQPVGQVASRRRGLRNRRRWRGEGGQAVERRCHATSRAGRQPAARFPQPAQSGGGGRRLSGDVAQPVGQVASWRRGFRDRRRRRGGQAVERRCRATSRAGRWRAVLREAPTAWRRCRATSQAGRQQIGRLRVMLWLMVHPGAARQEVPPHAMRFAGKATPVLHYRSAVRAATPGDRPVQSTHQQRQTRGERCYRQVVPATHQIRGRVVRRSTTMALRRPRRRLTWSVVRRSTTMALRCRCLSRSAEHPPAHRRM